MAFFLQHPVSHQLFDLVQYLFIIVIFIMDISKAESCSSLFIKSAENTKFSPLFAHILIGPMNMDTDTRISNLSDDPKIVDYGSSEGRRGYLIFFLNL